MNDPIISKRLNALAEHIRTTPAGPVREGLVDACFNLVGYLESRHLIEAEMWRMAPRVPATACCPALVSQPGGPAIVSHSICTSPTLLPVACTPMPTATLRVR